MVVTNVGDTLYETSYANDVDVSAQQVDISLTPPVDLVAGTITIPANAVPGEDMTFSYTVTNESSQQRRRPVDRLALPLADDELRLHRPAPGDERAHRRPGRRPELHGPT